MLPSSPISPAPWFRMMLWLVGAGLFLFLPQVESAEFSSTITIDENAQMKLADHFFQEGDYEQAITEYKRFLFFFPQSPRSDEALLKIAQSFLNGKKWNEAIQAIDRLLSRFPQTSFLDRAFFLKGIAYREQNEHSKARALFERTKKLTVDPVLRDEAQKEIALTFVREENWGEAIRAFRQIDPASPLYGFAEPFAQGLERIHELPYKSPQVAGFLAAILPGAGHLYVERYRDAGIAFLLNAAFLWGMVESFERKNYVVGGILTFFEIGWYSGNIYSAVSGAHKFNRKQKKDFLHRLEQDHQLKIGVTQWGSCKAVLFELRF